MASLQTRFSVKADLHSKLEEGERNNLEMTLQVLANTIHQTQQHVMHLPNMELANQRDQI